MLLSWTKIVLADELLASDLPDDPYLDLDLTAYFPQPMQEGFAEQIRAAPAAPRDHRDPGRQRPGQRRRHDVLAPARGRDRRDGRRADPRQLRGPRDLRVAAAARRAQGLRQQARRRACRPGCGSRCAPSSSAPRAGWSPTGGRRSTARAPSTTSAQPVQALMAQLPRPDDRPRARAPARRGATASSSRACPRTSRPGWRCSTRRTSLLGIVEIADARRPSTRRRSRGSTSRSASGSACSTRDAADPRAAARGPLADDGAGRAARRPVRRAHPAHRQVLARQRRRTTRRRPGSPPGRRATRSPSAAPRRRSRRSAPTTQPTWPGSRSGCGWSAGCCRAG